MILFSIISIIFYYILCKVLVYIDYKERISFKMIHFLLLSLVACIPIINVVEMVIILIALTIAIINNSIAFKNSDNRIIKFLNKEL